MSFHHKLKNAWQKNESLLCIGLDPDLQKIPAILSDQDEPIFAFNQQIIDHTAAYCCCFKPQIAYYSAVGAEVQLEKTITYIQDNYPDHLVILDAKRGDIGATAQMYAKEAFVRYGADAVTVNPYMGGDTLVPYLEYADKGVVILCRTSNQGSAEFQALQCDGQALAHHVATSARKWNSHKNVMLVVGATYPEEIKQIREIVGDIPLLVPGVGAQGGGLQAVLELGLDKNGTGLIINSSRGIIYASEGAEYAAAAGKAANQLNFEINQLRNQII